MTFSYSDPRVIVRDGLRLLCGDTRSSQALLQDEEYDFVMAQWPEEENSYMLASYCAETIAAKFAREIDFSADSQTVSASSLQQKYTELALQLRLRAKTSYAGEVYVGGLDPFGVGPDPTIAPPAFGTQMHDAPEAGQQDYGDQGSYSRDSLWSYER